MITSPTWTSETAKLEPRKSAVATVVVFGTLAIFLYPVLYHLIAQYHLFDLSPTARVPGYSAASAA